MSQLEVVSRRVRRRQGGSASAHDFHKSRARSDILRSHRGRSPSRRDIFCRRETCCCEKCVFSRQYSPESRPRKDARRWKGGRDSSLYARKDRKYDRHQSPSRKIHHISRNDRRSVSPRHVHRSEISTASHSRHFLAEKHRSRSPISRYVYPQLLHHNHSDSDSEVMSLQGSDNFSDSDYPSKLSSPDSDSSSSRSHCNRRPRRSEVKQTDKAPSAKVINKHVRNLPKHARKAIARTARSSQKVSQIDDALTEEWTQLATKGIEKPEVYKQLYKDYDPAIHMRALVPPAIDDELLPHLTKLTTRRDNSLEATQQNLARAMMASGAALSILQQHMKQEEDTGEQLPMPADLSSDLYGYCGIQRPSWHQVFTKLLRLEKHC
uniref:Uncharacterized protein n=2 Tax=Lygus hesperus TaxID=30085 RepID=A0A0K8T425_LYGHE